ncbi:MAG TPA: type II toxin-antitoxin system VapC family toxin [Pirellulaceae bacterium]|nr:type II toxin-antitoxin system VapC family toxin [Pirellulaceae bacterium]
MSPVLIFDTDHLVILQRESEAESSRIRDKMSRFATSDFFVTIVSFHEQVAGWYDHLAKAKKQRDVVFAYGMFREVLTDFKALQVLDYYDLAAATFASFVKQRIRVGTMDLRIASIAVANDMTLLTRNTVDFQRVPGLRFEDWTLQRG